MRLSNEYHHILALSRNRTISTTLRLCKIGEIAVSNLHEMLMKEHVFMCSLCRFLQQQKERERERKMSCVESRTYNNTISGTRHVHIVHIVHIVHFVLARRTGTT